MNRHLVRRRLVPALLFILAFGAAAAGGTLAAALATCRPATILTPRAAANRLAAQVYERCWF